MKLSTLIERYVEHKRSLGMIFSTEDAILHSFARSMGEVDAEDVVPEAVCRFLDGKGPRTRFWLHKYEALDGFYRFALNRHHVSWSPLPRHKPEIPNDFTPYIYSVEDMKRLLAAVSACQERPWRLQPHTFRTLLLLLYGTGLRISEAVGLKLSDFDINARVLTIRATKFYKTRYVPVGDDIFQVLRDYIERQWPARCINESTPLLSTRQQQPVSRKQAERAFLRIRTAAGICRPDSVKHGPRLHDFRHTFAVVRLLTWYREGKDVQRLLPRLSTYLGHYTLQSTQRYLTMTPEVLHEANARFERYAQPEVCHA